MQLLLPPLDALAQRAKSLGLSGAEMCEPAVAQRGERLRREPIGACFALRSAGNEAALAKNSQMSRNSRTGGVAELGGDLAGAQRAANAQQIEDAPPRWVCDAGEGASIAQRWT